MTLNIYVVPLTNSPQTFAINLANVNYVLTVKWNNSADGGWVLDIADSTGSALAAGLPLVTGADVLSGLEYLEIDGALFAYTDGDANAVPTFDNLGENSNLYFQTTATNNG